MGFYSAVANNQDGGLSKQVIWATYVSFFAYFPSSNRYESKENELEKSIEKLILRLKCKNPSLHELHKVAQDHHGQHDVDNEHDESLLLVEQFYKKIKFKYFTNIRLLYRVRKCKAEIL